MLLRSCLNNSETKWVTNALIPSATPVEKRTKITAKSLPQAMAEQKIWDTINSRVAFERASTPTWPWSAISPRTSLNVRFQQWRWSLPLFTSPEFNKVVRFRAMHEFWDADCFSLSPTNVKKSARVAHSAGRAEHFGWPQLLASASQHFGTKPTFNISFSIIRIFNPSR